MDKRRTTYIIIAVATLIVPAYLYLTQEREIGESITYGDVTIEQAFELIERNPELVIVDVRTQEEYDSGHIENAVLIHVAELEARMGELSKEVDLLIYCRTGNRSRTAVNTLKTKGFTRIYHMKDGITAWIRAGQPVFR